MVQRPKLLIKLVMHQFPDAIKMYFGQEALYLSYTIPSKPFHKNFFHYNYIYRLLLCRSCMHLIHIGLPRAVFHSFHAIISLWAAL